MVSTLSKHWTRASFVRNCGELLVSGGSSESEQLVGGGSCAVSTMQLWKQECEEGNIPEPLCPPEWHPSNKTAEVRSPRQTEQYASERVFEEQPAPQDFQNIEVNHNCPECGARIESQASRCRNCLVKLEWQLGTPKAIERKIEIEEGRPYHRCSVQI